LIPWLVLTLKTIASEREQGLHFGQIARQGLFYVLFFAERGVEVDAFYRLQVVLFGDGNDVETIVKKVLVDQFVYSMLFAAPINMLCFLWKDLDFSFSKLKEALDWSFVTFRWPCGVVSAWIVWIPAVSCIYVLPSSLQIPLFNLVLCFFVLLLTFVSKRAKLPTND